MVNCMISKQKEEKIHKMSGNCKNLTSLCTYRGKIDIMIKER